MEPILASLLQKKLQQWLGKVVYIHFEVNPGGYFRNGKATLYAAHVKGNDPFRVFLELDQQQAIIQVDDLTHMHIEDEMVIVTGYDSHDRLARTLEICTQPFRM
jgi:Protein of unknown function (DUF1806)